LDGPTACLYLVSVADDGGEDEVEAGTLACTWQYLPPDWREGEILAGRNLNFGGRAAFTRGCYCSWATGRTMTIDD